jgi:magnesium chelatase subunit H
MVMFNFPPNAGNTGTAAYLSVFQSLFNTLRAMREEGYNVDVPENVDALRERIIERQCRPVRRPWPTSSPASRRTTTSPRAAPGRDRGPVGTGAGQAADRRPQSLFVSARSSATCSSACSRASATKATRCACCSNAASRPRMPSGLLSLPPRGLRRHAVLHFGTHGALEFMPGKQAGMADSCWPQRLIGDLPNYYLYASNNPPRDHRQAPRRRHPDQLPHAADHPCGSLQGPAGTERDSIERWRSGQDDAETRCAANSRP